MASLFYWPTANQMRLCVHCWFAPTRHQGIRPLVTRVECYDTIVVGGGQAGLAAGYHLAQKDIDFLILDGNERVEDSWRNRWEERYAERFDLPVRRNTRVTNLEWDGERFVLSTRSVTYLGNNVIVATGARERLPDYGWIALPVFGNDGYPRQERGVVAEAPGLYFLLRFQDRQTSRLGEGVGADAAYIAEVIRRS